MPQNIAYHSDVIGDFYGTHRRRWKDFYQSERHVLDTLVGRGAKFADVLDVGCAAGGFGDALSERFGSVKTYTGVDINRHAIDVAAKLASGSGGDRKFIVADICDCGELVDRTFDLVTLFGVPDWNVDARGIVTKCWERVRPDGHLVVSLRLTPHHTICDIERSFQFVWFEPTPAPSDAERAPYHVFNISEAITWLAGQTPRPEHLYLYGYWGKPSSVARTPYQHLLFSVFALRKPAVQGLEAEPTIEAHLPASAFTLAAAANVDRV
jgi:SAM-dependent methyltransferase